MSTTSIKHKMHVRLKRDDKRRQINGKAHCVFGEHHSDIEITEKMKSVGKWEDGGKRNWKVTCSPFSH